MVVYNLEKKMEWMFYFSCLVLLTTLIRVLPVTSQNVGLTLESASSSLPNNAIVSASQIGSSTGLALTCFSNNTNFNSDRQWISPDGTPIQSIFSDTVYILRAPGAIMLYRTRSLPSNLEGIYTCRIRDSNDVQHVLYTGIYSDANFQNGVPVIPSPPSFSLLTPFDNFPPTFTLYCESNSFPPTNVTWLLDGEPVDLNDEDFQTSQMLVDSATTTYNNGLTVFANYSGEFTCQIANSRGVNQRSYTVTEPSASPTIMDPDFLGSGNVSITWARPSGDVYGYQLFFRLSSNGSEEVVNITSPTTTQVILRSLSAGATYNVSILAYADLPTERSEVLSLTLNVADLAENITVTGASPTSLNVSWSHSGVNVIRYIIRYTSTGTGCPGISGGSLIAPSNVTQFIISGLEEDTDYDVTIRTVSEAAVGDPSVPVTGRTLISMPSAPPRNVTVIAIDPDRFFISWEPPPCLEQNGGITNYSVTYFDLLVNSGNTVSNILGTNVTLQNRVSPFRNASFRVSAVNSAGSGNLSSPVYNHLIGNPGRVAGFSVVQMDVTSIWVEWIPPLLPTVFINDFTYEVSWAQSQTPDQIIHTESNIRGNRYEVPNLAPNTSYTLSVTPVSSYTNGQPVSRPGTTTILGRVGELSVIQDTESSVNVSWALLESDDIIYYEIYFNSSAEMNETIRVNVTQMPPITIFELDSGRRYDFTVAAFVEGNDTIIRGPPSNVVQFTFSISSNTMLVIIVVCSSVGGLILLIFVIIITTVFLLTLSNNLGPQLANKGVDDEDYIPLNNYLHIELEEVDSVTEKVGPPTIVGDLTGDIHSVEGQEVVIRFIAHGSPKPSLKWKLDNEEISWESSSFIHKDGTIIFKRVEVEHAGVYTLSAVNANGSCEKSVKLIVYPDTEITRHPEESDAITSISKSLNEFGQYVASLHADGNKKFRDQFKMLSSGEVAHPIKEVLDDKNRPYNRFQHIIVYDDNRIKLEILPRYLDCQHEYINACYVKGEGKNGRNFIATQGPLEHSVADMWRLVWQERAPVIVMLTKTREDLRIKCSQYWPSAGSGQYGPFTVNLLQETHFHGYTIREFSVHYNTMANNIRARIVNPRGRIKIDYIEPFSNAKSTLRVTQYHYTEWLEHSTAENLPSLLEMHEKAMSRPPVHPIVVHCSNGVGRTGAFIAMDMALEQCRTQKAIDIPSIVADIRNQRMKMIQTLDQFMLVHDAVIDKIICGDNHIHVKDFHAQVMRLDGKAEHTHGTGFDSQFNILEQVTVAPQHAACSYAKQFPRKNREDHTLPTNLSRVALKGESPDYINATYVLGYNNPKAFVVTQGPLRETRRDFWKMIFDQEITTVVMLSSAVENDVEVCAQYWPSSGNVEFGEFLVAVKDTFVNEGFTRRILLMKEVKTNTVRRVVQYQVNGWSNDNYSFLGVVNTINLVATTQRKTSHIPVLVHCSNGIGRSAMFCAVMATIEQCKGEGVVDIFKLIKSMRVQLPGAIQTKEQYKTVHRLVVAYLNLFSTSANFEHF